MTVKFGCFHTVYENKRATEFVLEQFRKYHPDAPYTICCDGGVDYSDLTKKYNCNYVHSYMRIGRRNSGHPSGVYGFTKDESLHWIHMFREAAIHVKNGGGSHMIMMEDDVLTQGEVKIDPDWQCAGFDVPGNKISPSLLEYIRQRYGATPNVDWYGAGGGTIFNIDTFLNHYHQIYDFIDFEFDFILNNFDYRFGWLDLYMQIAYFILGKNYSINTNLTEVWKTPDYKNTDFSLVHAYKELY
jgi:hypothetical protein